MVTYQSCWATQWSMVESQLVATSVKHSCVGSPIWNVLFISGWWFQLLSPLPGEMIHFDQYFSNGLKPPTRSLFILPRCQGGKLELEVIILLFLLEIVSHPSAGTQPRGMWLWWVFRKGWHMFIGKRVSMQSFKTDF